MPIYEYQCENESCGIRFERMQSFSADPLADCPTCGGPVHRVIQPVGVIFKGSGFYVTDNRSKSSTMPPLRKETEGDAGSSDSGSPSTDSTKVAKEKPAKEET